jgi:hypothetical protein
MRAIFATTSFDFFDTDGFATLAFWQQMLCRTRFVNHVNGLVGQFAIRDVACGQFDGVLIASAVYLMPW